MSLSTIRFRLRDERVTELEPIRGLNIKLPDDKTPDAVPGVTHGGRW